MIKFKQFVRQWLIPPGIWTLLSVAARSLRKLNQLAMASMHLCNEILDQNKDLLNRHTGERCFILCNGPSVKQQNLLPLKNEIVISVSSGYLHKDFDVIAPKYHCVPNITYGKLKEEHVIEWFTEMDEKLGSAELFLSMNEYELVQKHHLFMGRKVHYLSMERPFVDGESSLIDLTTVIPGVQSVPIMALMVAMYLGIKDIYLIGTEHNSYQLNKYTYAFEPTVIRGFGGVDDEGNVNGGMYDELWSNARLWQQYRNIKNIAAQNGVSIFNATLGGALDEFERVDLDSLWGS